MNRHPSEHGDIRATQAPIRNRAGVVTGRRVTVTRLTDGTSSTARCTDDFDGPDGVFAVADRLALALLEASAGTVQEKKEKRE